MEALKRKTLKYAKRIGIQLQYLCVKSPDRPRRDATAVSSSIVSIPYMFLSTAVVPFPMLLILSTLSGPAMMMFYHL